MVAMNVWPTDGAAGSVATEARWRSMARHWAPSGIAAGVGGEMALSLSFPTLTVQSGACWVDGHYCELLTTQTLTATANGIAVVRFDPAANSADLIWRDGVSVPAESPTGTWELAIARTSASALGDLRVNSLVQSQRVPSFANAAVRTSKIPVPTLNQLSSLDTAPGVLQFWNGAAWANVVPPVPTVPPQQLPAGTKMGFVNIALTTDVDGSTGTVLPIGFSSAPVVVATDNTGTLGWIALTFVDTGLVGFNAHWANGLAVSNASVRIHYMCAGPA